jgi:two-component system osmolarity sensor histidine kinase EnvZ
MSADLSALEEDRSIALAGISHDLRSPLTRLRLELEMADLPDAQRQSMIEDIERIDAIVGQFVDYARLGTAVLGQQVDASAEVLALADRYRTLAQPGGLPQLAANVTQDLVWRGEAADLRRVVSNLVDNAIRHGRRDGHGPQIELGLTRDARGLVISVEDDGPGIAPGLYAQALRPFSRLDPARTDWGGAGAGSGLGLAIVARIVRRYEGELRLDNGPLGGLRVQISLPDAR